MKVEIPFCRWTGKAALEIEIPDDTEERFRLRAAVEIAVKSRANLAGANLADAYLAGAYLADADLAGANLAGANLADAYLADAYLAGANLAGANLAGAYLADADLACANLAGANLAGANLVGGIKLNGNVIATITPIQIFGFKWPVTISDRHIQIGCEVHTTDDWAAFDDRKIASMDGADAARFWSQWKDVVLSAARAHQEKLKGQNDG